MEKYRSQSCRDNGMMDMSNNGGYPNSMKDLRSYTTNRNMKKSASKNWMSDPEVQRKKRVAGYKVYGMEILRKRQNLRPIAHEDMRL
ncbi:hypothetical protein CTI12_AA285440 [Artemisia annua]|uniref:Uncharacterized protein n=1 Tax=Artemisia annua TaxID=35608 RepID=A0A2U1NBG8_ARTAN|nr:hypothetical protein CTI12_AA285440 [Artemisia annua]